MSEQQDLFDAGRGNRESRRRWWLSVPQRWREELISLLAQMEKAAIQAERINRAAKRKAAGDES